MSAEQQFYQWMHACAEWKYFRYSCGRILLELQQNCDVNMNVIHSIIIRPDILSNIPYIDSTVHLNLQRGAYHNVATAKSLKSYKYNVYVGRCAAAAAASGTDIHFIRNSEWLRESPLGVLHAHKRSIHQITECSMEITQLGNIATNDIGVLIYTIDFGATDKEHPSKSNFVADRECSLFPLNSMFTVLPSISRRPLGFQSLHSHNAMNYFIFIITL